MTPLGLSGTSTHAVPLGRVEEMMDAHVMGPRLAAALGGVLGGHAHVLDAKYEPGLRCIVLYRAGDRLVRGDLLVEPSGGPEDARPIVAPGVRLSVFPDDPDLPGLAAAVDPARLRRALEDALPKASPGSDPILRCRVDLVRYRPGKRATLAVEVRGPSAPTRGRAQRFVVKSYHDGRKAAAVAAEAVLLDATIDPDAPLRFAPVRAHLPDLSLVVQEHVAGIHLEDVLRLPGSRPGHALRRAAVALAALHAQPVVSGRVRAIDSELARFTTRGLRVAQVDSGTGAALVDLAARLAATASDVPTGTVGLVHGDCKPSQFLLRGEREVVLLDLDSCGQADPAGDVGTFLATLRQQGVRELLARRTTRTAARARAGLAEVFLGEYLAAAGGAAKDDLRRRIAWYEAVALERKALRCFARAPRSPLTRALVHSAHACLDRLGGIR
jgi:aminoglycoside phosphotransferase (APT) family kinase protein